MIYCPVETTITNLINSAFWYISNYIRNLPQFNMSLCVSIEYIINQVLNY